MGAWALRPALAYLPHSQCAPRRRRILLGTRAAEPGPSRRGRPPPPGDRPPQLGGTCHCCRGVAYWSTTGQRAAAGPGRGRQASTAARGQGPRGPCGRGRTLTSTVRPQGPGCPWAAPPALFVHPRFMGCDLRSKRCREPLGDYLLPTSYPHKAGACMPDKWLLCSIAALVLHNLRRVNARPLPLDSEWGAMSGSF